MSDPSNNDDDLLLLTMRVDTDEDSLSELNRKMLALRETMQDTAKTIDFSAWDTPLNAAVQALRAAVSAWNSLENKTIGVATDRNYLPYGISAGEAESINTKIAANKIAQQTGLSGGGVLSSLIRISEEQYNVKGLGHDPNQDDWVALYTLGRALGDDRFTGDNLSQLLTDATSVDVLTAISDLLAKANRKAYSMPEGSEQRQSWIKMINRAQASPYVPDNLETYLALMTKPENQTWGKRGDPFKQLISGTPEDIGNYNKSLEKESAKALSVHSALSSLKTEREEFWNRVGTSAYNIVGESVVLPLSNSVTAIAKALSGKAMSKMPFEGYSLLDYIQVVNPYSKAKMEKGKFSSSVLLDETGTVFKGDLKARAAKAKQYATGTDIAPLGELGDLKARAAQDKQQAKGTGTDIAPLGELGDLKARAAQDKQQAKGTGTDRALLGAPGIANALLGELGLYELAKMSQADFNVQSVTAMLYARDALVRNVTSKMTYSEGKKKGKRLSAKDAYAAAEEMLTSEDSPYAQAYKAGGFTGLYSELYKNQALTAKDYLALMERVINETKHNEINKFYGDVDKNSEVKADVRKVDGQNVLRVVLTVKDESTGKTLSQQETALTPDQVASMRLNLGGI